MEAVRPESIRVAIFSVNASAKLWLVSAAAGSAMVAVAPCCVFVISVRCSLRVCHLFLKRIISLSIPLPLHLRLLSHYYTSSSLSFRMTIHHFCFPLLRSPIYFVSFQHRKCPHFSSEDFIFFFFYVSDLLERQVAVGRWFFTWNHFQKSLIADFPVSPWGGCTWWNDSTTNFHIFVWTGLMFLVMSPRVFWTRPEEEKFCFRRTDRNISGGPDLGCACVCLHRFYSSLVFFFFFWESNRCAFFFFYSLALFLGRTNKDGHGAEGAGRARVAFPIGQWPVCKPCLAMQRVRDEHNSKDGKKEEESLSKGPIWIGRNGSTFT